jgi:(2R)-ethylmalonyl-CoA mutase
MKISYEGIRLTPDEIITAARHSAVHVIGLSILSGSHMPLMQELMAKLQAAELSHIPVIVGGIIPDEDAQKLRAMGIARIYTPKDFELNQIMFDIVALADPGAGDIAAQ